MNNSLFNAYTLTGTFDIYANSAETINFQAETITCDTITTNTATVEQYIEFSDATRQYTSATSFDPTQNITFSGNDEFTGDVNFVQIPTCSGVATLPNELPNKAYVDLAIQNVVADTVLPDDNAWTGHNTYNTYLPTSTLSCTAGGEFAIKTYVDGKVVSLLSLNNTWSGTNTFDTHLPTSTQTVSGSTQLTTKVYVDTTISGSITLLKSSANAWTSTNTFNSVLPTSSLTPSSSSDLTTKTYVDGLVSGGVAGLLTSANSWSNTNAYISYLPTSSLTPSSNSQLTNKLYVDNQVAGLLSSGNVWTNTNTFNSHLPTSTQTVSGSTQLTTKSYVDTKVSATISGLINSPFVITSTTSPQLSVLYDANHYCHLSLGNNDDVSLYNANISGTGSFYLQNSNLVVESTQDKQFKIVNDVSGVFSIDVNSDGTTTMRLEGSGSQSLYVSNLVEMVLNCTLRPNGPIDSTDATNSTSASTGAIHTDGGVGITQDIYVGGKAYIVGSIFSTNTVGVFLINGDPFSGSYIPILRSCSNFNDLYDTSGDTITRQDTGLGSVGSVYTVDGNDRTNYIMLFPNYGCVGYSAISYGSTLLINAKNTTTNPMVVDLVSTESMSSLKVYYNNVEIT